MTQLLHSAVNLPAGGDFHRIEVTQVGGVIGAIVAGIRIGGDVEPAALLRAIKLAPYGGTTVWLRLGCCG